MAASKHINLSRNELYQLYWNDSLTQGEIGKIKGCDPATILYWMRKYNVPSRSYSEGVKLGHLKHPRLFNTANLKPSPELAYVFGVILGDGSISVTKFNYSWRGKMREIINRGITLRCKDKDFAEHFHLCLSKILKNPVHSPYLYEGTRLWIVSAQSKQLNDFLRSKPFHVAEEFPADFIRGFADSDGSGFYYSDKYHRKPFVRISLDNTNLELLEQVKDLLWGKFGIESRIYNVGMKNGFIKKTGQHIIARHTAYKLFILKRASVAKFASEIGFNIKRKQDKIEEGMRLAGYA